MLFASHNLLKDPPFSKLALISCRNLLIYLQRDLQAKVFELFHYALEGHGYLFLGSAESAKSAAELFHSLAQQHRLYQRRRGTTRLAHHLPDLPLSGAARHRSTWQDAESVVAGSSPMPAIHQQALETYAPPSLLIDANHNVIHVSERAGSYLQVPSATPTTNALKLARREYRFELSSALQTAFDQGSSGLSRPVVFSVDGHHQTVRLYTCPIDD